MNNKQIVGYIPKLLFKIYLYLKDKFDPPKPIIEEEIICYEICKKLISLKDSKLTTAPLSSKRYIKNDEHRMFIVIENRMVTLINHIYSYNVYFENDNNYYEIINLIDSEVERKRLELEEEIQSNIKHSLKNILNNLSDQSINDLIY
jgi:hypothetical protein